MLVVLQAARLVLGAPEAVRVKPLSLGKARCHRDTPSAILVTIFDEGQKQRWVPKVCIHDTSKVYESGHVGELIINDGSAWARAEGFSD
jgi:hypothetical protein